MVHKSAERATYPNLKALSKNNGIKDVKYLHEMVLEPLELLECKECFDVQDLVWLGVWYERFAE